MGDDHVGRDDHAPAPCSPASASPPLVGSDAGEVRSSSQLVRVALARAERGVYAFALRYPAGGVEIGYVAVGSGQRKHRPGRGRHPILTPDALVAALAEPAADLHLVVIVEDLYSDDDGYVPPWAAALSGAARVASLSDVRIDELDEAVGVPLSIAETDEGYSMLGEIIFDRTGVGLDHNEHALARAVALLLAEEDLRGDGGLEDTLALLEEPDPARESSPSGSTSATPPSPHLTVAELAKHLGISRSSAYGLQDAIPHTKSPGVGVRFRREDVEAYLRKHERPAGAERRSALFAGMTLASACDDDDDEEVTPGVTRGDLKKKAGF